MKIFSLLQVKLPLVCDIMCTMDIFLLALPMFIMVGLSIHMFTRAPSPHFNPFPVDDDYIGHNGLKSFLKDHSKFLLTVRHRYDVSASPESTLEFIMKIEEISNKKKGYRKNYSHLERISTQCEGPTYGTRRKIVASSSLEIGLMPKEPLWLSFLLPILPILGIHFMSSKLC